MNMRQPAFRSHLLEGNLRFASLPFCTRLEVLAVSGAGASGRACYTPSRRVHL
jgi:hypothetical protein